MSCNTEGGYIMNSTVDQAVIMAGGLGTRLKPYTDKHPKPMFHFNGKPFLEYLINQIKEFGINDIILLLGYKGQEIIDYFNDGSKYGVSIRYSVTPVEYETGDRLLAVREELRDSFLLMYCDNYCPIDFIKLANDYRKNKADIQLSAYANKDNYTRNNLLVDEDGRVLKYDRKREANKLNCVDIGYAIIKKTALDYIENSEEPKNFEKEVYPLFVDREKIFASVTEHRYYSIGSWERIGLTKEFFKGIKTVFLDRDGTLNERPPKACYIEKPEDFRWLPGAIKAVGLLKSKGYRVIILSNQPGIARGNMSEDTLQEIHQKMQNELKEQTGFEIDDIFYCSHDWNEGCDCRKPKPGLFYQAQKKYSINLRGNIMIGDDDRDMEAGNAAGCKCYQVSNRKSLLDIVEMIISEEE